MPFSNLFTVKGKNALAQNIEISVNKAEWIVIHFSNAVLV